MGTLTYQAKDNHIKSIKRIIKTDDYINIINESFKNKVL